MVAAPREVRSTEEAVARSTEEVVVGERCTKEGVVGASCGQYCTLLTTAAGRVVGLGDNKHGQLDAPALFDPTDPALPILSAGWTHVVALVWGVVRAWGRNNYHQLGGGSGGAAVCEGVVRVAAGTEHCLALGAAGGVLAWGWNEHGSCGAPGEVRFLLLHLRLLLLLLFLHLLLLRITCRRRRRCRPWRAWL